ncbi:WG repeat-containing protein [Hymenobacter sp. BT683]|uniref:WG repeat-containing protein n=1 Tax=Hymenobacter jeongseonensis TaxID=2791027 RepID=A0ABS0IG37_9BACT|nr:WG repeat-containing protein [Hymenobacter jeongseonensis]MBF9237326.1 WG repeat-containing protein [Hymenobacter jeongseonensis]
MVYSFIASPFAEAIRAQQYAAVLAALHAEVATDSLLLGNLVLEDGSTALDAVVLRPHGITLLAFVPKGGRLCIPALGYGRWQLDGIPLPGAEGFDNPFEQLVQQKQELEAWLGARYSSEQVNLRFVSSGVLFAAPVTFGPDVEPALSSAPSSFQLLSDLAEFSHCLRQLATPEINLTPDDLAEWAAEWAAFAERQQAPETAEAGSADAVSPPQHAGAMGPAAEAANAAGFLSQKAGALWRWLGAADVPDDDPAYGYNPTAAAARTQEKQQLEELRQQMQADLSSQLRALETRETERERSIAQLRAELAQAPAIAPEAAALEARLAIENREKEALEAAMQASRAESAARNQELDTKIQQLGQLIEKLNSQPVPQAVSVPHAAGLGTADSRPTGAAPGHAPISNRPKRPNSQAVPWAASQWQQLRERGRQRPRVAIAAGSLVALGLLGWALSQAGDTPLVPFQENGRWGYADANGKPVVPAKYTSASPFTAGQAVVAQDHVFGILNEKGEEVVAPAYDALNPYAGGFARVRVGDTYTFIDKEGVEFDHFYFNALDFSEGYAAVLDYRGWHYISGPNSPDTPAVIFTEAYSFVDGLARVNLADGYTYITPDYLEDPSRGTKPFGRYTQVADFDQGQARVTQNGRSFLIDKDGEEVK